MMEMVTARGAGSNQYQDRAPTASGAPLVNQRDVRRSVAEPGGDDVEAEQVAWAFRDDREDWFANGITAWDEASAWMRSGFIPRVAGWWKKQGVSPDAAARWKTLLPGDEKRWMAEGFDDPDIAKRWSDSGFSPKGAWLSAAQNYVTPRHAAEDWLSYSFERSHLPGWGEVSGSPREAQQWRDAGFLLEESRQAAAWHDEGVAVDVAKAWHTHGLTPEDRESWNKVGVQDPELAREWERELEGEIVVPARAYAEWDPAGFTPTLAGYWIGRGVYSPTEVPSDEDDDNHMVNG